MTARRAWIGVAAIAAVALIGAGLWLWLAGSRPSTPEDAAASFLRALEAGDAGAVQAGGLRVTESAVDALAGAEDLIDHAEVGRVEIDGDRATAAVSFRLGGDQHAATLRLLSTNGRWAVDASSLGSLAATTTVGSFVGIGKAVVESGDHLALLPAVYAVEALPADLLSGGTTTTVLPGEAAEVTIDPQLRESATAAAQAQLDEHLESCTAGTGEQLPARCGIRIPWGADLASVTGSRFRIEQLPTLSLDPAGFHAGGGILVATLTGPALDGAERSFTYRTDAWSVRGEVAFTAEELQLVVW